MPINLSRGQNGHRCLCRVIEQECSQQQLGVYLTDTVYHGGLHQVYLTERYSRQSSRRSGAQVKCQRALNLPNHRTIVCLQRTRWNNQHAGLIAGNQMHITMVDMRLVLLRKGMQGGERKTR